MENSENSVENLEHSELNKAFLEALKQENDRLLEEHMRKLELHFDEKLNYMLAHLEAATKSSAKATKKRLPSDAPSAISAFLAAAEQSEVSMSRARHDTEDKKIVEEEEDLIESKDDEVKEQPVAPAAASPKAQKKIPPQLRVYSEPVVQPLPPAPKKKKSVSSASQSNDNSSVDSSIPKNIERKLDSATRSALSKSQHLIQEALSMTSKRKKKKSKQKQSTAQQESSDVDPGDGGASSDESITKIRPATTLPQVKPPQPMMRTVTFSGPIGLKYEEAERRMHAVASAPNLVRKRSKGDTFPSLKIEGAIDVFDETVPSSPSKFVHSSDTPNAFLNNRAWENDIARHILSIYASTKMQDDPKASTAVLDFVETDATSSKNLLNEGILQMKSSDINFNKTPRRASATQRKANKGDRKLSQSSLDNPLNAGISGLPKSKKLDYKEREVINTTVRATQTPRIVRAPPKCFPIWFISSGDDIYAEWLTLPGKEQLQGHLDRLREKKQYKEYVDIVENILSTLLVNILYREEKERERIARSQEIIYTGSPKASSKVAADAVSVKSADTRTESSDEVELTKEDISVLWRQLVLQAESWCSRDDIFPAEMRAELKSYVHNTMAYYFYRKKMTRATLNHTKQAMMYYKKVKNYEYMALCLLHQSCGEYQMSNFKGALQTLYTILEMVEEGQLAFEETKPKQLCMVAVAYHNLAVVQLKLRSPDSACKSSQNARKIARLCLSHSNRWLNTFHWTHQLALEGVKYELSTNPNLTQKQIATLNELTEMMFDPTPT